jgi:hypothetical protein
MTVTENILKENQTAEQITTVSTCVISLTTT